MIEENNIKNKIKNVIYYLVPFVIMFILLIPMPYYITLGGGVINLDKKISVEEEKESGYYGALYVRESKAVLITYLISYLSKDFERVKIEEVLNQETEESYNYREGLLFTSSLDNALKIAFEKASKKVDISSSKFYVIYIDENADIDLQIQDEIIRIGAEKFRTYDEMVSLIEKQKEDVLITVIRDGKEIVTRNNFVDINGDKKLGIIVSNVVNYTSNPKVSFNFSEKQSGPSGGLIAALTIYDKITDNDLTKNRKIMGTGSIDSDGNVLEIGGIKYKLMAANNKNADIVFVPNGNYNEAKLIKDDKGYKFDLVPVKTFDQAVDYLKR